MKKISPRVKGIVYTVCRLRFFHDVGIHPAGGDAYGGKGLLPQHCGPGRGGRSVGGEAGAAEAGKGQLAVHHRPGGSAPSGCC